MTLDDLHRICVGSEPDDWRVIDRGPQLLLPEAHSWINDDTGQHEQFESHLYRAAYKPNLSIGLAWGMPYLDRFEAPWANRFPNPSASSHLLDILYNGMLVDRHPRIYVDGSRAGLPLPEMEHIDDNATVTNLRITRWQYRFFALIDQLEGKAEFQRYVEWATFEIVG